MFLQVGYNVGTLYVLEADMNERLLTTAHLVEFRQFLLEDEKSEATIEKYMRDAGTFLSFAGQRAVTKELVMAFKQELIMGGKYTVGSINSMLSSVRSLLGFLHWDDCCVKAIRIQRQIYCAREKELTKEEYLRLLDAAKGQRRLWLLLQTICSTGIRVSELKYFTVKAVCRGEISVHCKNKTRTILIPGKLQKLLLEYCREAQIENGVIFRTRSGKPLDRSNIWAMMKRLCTRARVAASKVFPHNLRKLFARTFYQAKHDIATLADVLGHTSINTTRIYIMATRREHQAKIDNMDLVIDAS